MNGGRPMKKVLLLMGFIWLALVNVAYATEQVDEKKAEVQKSDQMIIVNKAVNKLAFYEDGRLVHVFSVATGANASSTPEGDFHVNVKWECPVYYKGKNGPCENGNPLGPRWIGLDVPGTSGYTYGIHGNASAWSIGTYASAGCVRMHNWQVTQLFEIVKYNTPVTIIRSNQSFDEIAKAKGYEVKQTVKKNEHSTIIGKVKTYYGSHEKLIVEGASLEDQEVNVVETIGKWKRVETLGEKKSYWLNTENIIAGKTIKENAYLLLKETDTILAYPKEEANKTHVEKPFIAQSTQHVGDWYYIEFSENGSGWVQSNKVKQVSQTEWATQENMPKYTEEWMEKWQKAEKEQADFWLIMKELLT